MRNNHLEFIETCVRAAAGQLSYDELKKFCALLQEENEINIARLNLLTKDVEYLKRKSDTIHLENQKLLNRVNQLVSYLSTNPPPKEKEHVQN